MPHVTDVLDHPTPTASPPSRRRRVLLAVAGVVLVAVVVVFAPAALRIIDDPAGSAAVTGIDDVQVSDDRFDPPVIQVPAGTTVTWHFADGGVDHNVVGEGWQSEVQETGTFLQTFAAPGSYPYTCTLHPGMDGRVEVVQP